MTVSYPIIGKRAGAGAGTQVRSLQERTAAAGDGALKYGNKERNDAQQRNFIFHRLGRGQ